MFSGRCGSSGVPQNGTLSLTRGNWKLLGVPAVNGAEPCLTHCVSPPWPAISAMALGVEGPLIVMWKLSITTKRSAYCHMNGMVSQSTWPIGTSPACLVASDGLVVGGSRVVFDTIWPLAFVV